MTQVIRRKATYALRSISRRLKERRRRLSWVPLMASPHIRRDIGLYDTDVRGGPRSEISRVTLG